MNQNLSNFVIYQKYLELIYYTNDIVRKYPKSETFTLVSEIKNTTYKGLSLIIHALKLYKPNEKLQYLNEMDIQMNILKVHVRLSYKYKYISSKNYQVWSEHITNICNMLGAWISKCLKK